MANRQALVQAAQVVFSEDGFEAASVREISQRAGLALGTFYNYFADKAAIFDAVVVEGFGRLRESTQRERRAARDPASFWRAALAPVFAGLVDEAGFFHLLLRTESLIRERHHALLIEAPQARLVADIEAAVAAGWMPLPVIPAPLLAAAVYGAVFEIFRRLLAEDHIDATRAETVLGFATRLLLEGAAGGVARLDPPPAISP